MLFGKPADPKAFDEEYWKDHVPLARQMPGVKKYTVNKIVGAPRGEPAYYQMVEVEFDNMDSLKKALESSASRESGKHAVKMATGGITFLYAEPKEA
ncbi:MAG TPA: EthD family reductase [Candidatus Binatus sp.]|nr:EthD family reductase [Candidatus Binatus sp.]